MSVRLRTALVAAAAFAVVFAATAAIGIGLLRASLRDEVDRSIETRALDIEIQTADEEEAPFVGAGLDPTTAAAVVDIDGTVLSSTDDLDGEFLVELYQEHDDAFDVSFPDLDSVDGSSRMRGIAVQVVESDEFVETFVFVAASTEGLERTVRAARNAALIIGPVLVVVVGALVYIMAGRALRPVERIRREVEEISGSDLHRRVPEPGSGDEIEALAVTMNGMLARIEHDAGRQRRFAADASHELRSPLASMAAQLDVDLAHQDTADWAATATALRAETSRMQTLVDDLLLLARSDDGVASGPPARARPVALDDLVLDTLARLAPEPRITITTERVGRVDVVGDPTQLGRMVANLVLNARRHARSAVELGLTAAHGRAVFTVDDDGPGIPDADRERVFERFVRLDEARSRDAGGSGLGLALCAQICRSHGGTIAVDASDLGGARLVVTLPLAPGAPS